MTSSSASPCVRSANSLNSSDSFLRRQLALHGFDEAARPLDPGGKAGVGGADHAVSEEPPGAAGEQQRRGGQHGEVDRASAAPEWTAASWLRLLAQAVADASNGVRSLGRSSASSLCRSDFTNASSVLLVDVALGAPELVHQLLARDDAPGLSHQALEQVVFGARERDGASRRA